MTQDHGAAMTKSGWSIRAYSRGGEAFRGGIALSNSPYESGTDEFEIWKAGWLMSEEFQLKKCSRIAGRSVY